MYKILKTDGSQIGLTEKINYIKIDAYNGCFVACPEAEAIGVAYESTPYNLFGHTEIPNTDTVIIAGFDVQALAAENQQLAEQLEHAEDALCDMDIAIEERLANIEMAMCEFDQNHEEE